MSAKNWYVLRVFTNSELTAEKQVKRLGYDAMVPYLQGLRRVRKNNRPWKWPLFPGYLFASWADWHAGWNHITGKVNPLDQITAIYNFLGPVWAPMPYILNAADVEYLQSIADGKYDPADDERRPLKVGDHVLIPEGPFEGKSGRLADISGKNATIEVKAEKIVMPVKIEVAKLRRM